MGYVLIRNDGKYVTNPGSEKSYTGKLEEARIFKTREDAERERCVENERVSAVNDVLSRS